MTGSEWERETEGGWDRERSVSRDSDSRCRKHNRAICWRAAHKAVVARSLAEFNRAQGQQVGPTSFPCVSVWTLGSAMDGFSDRFTTRNHHK